MRSSRSYLGIFLGLIFLSGIAGLAYYNSERLRAGPSIEISIPANGVTVTSPSVTILGTVRNVSFLTLNGRQIYADDQGAIREQVLLAEGYNVLILKGTDRFGRSVEEELELIY